MNRDGFWKIIDQARESADSIDDLAPKVLTKLKELNAEEIVCFAQIMSELVVESYRWDLWAVAYIINGGCGDDGFEYFRGWLLAQGRKRFESALNNPEDIGGWAKPGECECEDILYVGYDAYSEKTGEDLPAERIKVQYPSEPSGEPWEEDQLERLFPRLHAKFS